MSDADTARAHGRVLPDTIPPDEQSALHAREDALRREGHSRAAGFVARAQLSSVRVGRRW